MVSNITISIIFIITMRLESAKQYICSYCVYVVNFLDLDTGQTRQILDV